MVLACTVMLTEVATLTCDSDLDAQMPLTYPSALLRALTGLFCVSKLLPHVRATTSVTTTVPDVHEAKGKVQGRREIVIGSNDLTKGKALRGDYNRVGIVHELDA